MMKMGPASVALRTSEPTQSSNLVADTERPRQLRQTCKRPNADRHKPSAVPFVGACLFPENETMNRNE